MTQIVKIPLVLRPFVGLLIGFIGLIFLAFAFAFLVFAAAILLLLPFIMCFYGELKITPNGKGYKLNV